MTNDSHVLPRTYLHNLEGLSGWPQGATGWRAGDVLARLLVQLQLRQQRLLLLPQQMQPLLLLQLQLPLVLVLLLTVVEVKDLTPGAQVDVLLPQDVDQVHVLRKDGVVKLRPRW